MLLLSAYLFLLTPLGQNWLTQKALAYLSRQFDTKIELKNARFALFNRIRLEGLTVYDAKQDTLLHAGILDVRVTNWFFLKQNNELGPIRLENTLIKCQRDDSSWQHDQLLKQFISPASETKTEEGRHFQLKELDIIRSTLMIQDRWLGQDMLVSIEKLSLQANRLSPTDSIIDIRSLTISEPVIEIRNYTGKRINPTVSKPIDFFTITPFWNGPMLTAEEVRIEKGRFKWQKAGARSSPGVLNANDMEWSDLELTTNIHSTVDSFNLPFKISGKESSGLNIQDISGRLSGHATEWTWNDLRITTPNSQLQQEIKWIKTKEEAVWELSGIDTRIDPSELYQVIGTRLPINDPIELRGDVGAGANQIVAKNLWAQWGNQLRISGDLTANQWRSAEKWNLSVERSELFTTAAFAGKLTSLTTDQASILEKIGYAQVRGKGNVSNKQANFTGSLQTQLGMLFGSGEIRYPTHAPPSYLASLKGELSGLRTVLPGMGIQSTRLSMELNGMGASFIDANGALTNLRTNTYDFSPIRYTLSVREPRWEFSINVLDTNINGIVQISGEPFSNDPIVGIDARLNWMDLTALGWNPDGLTLKGSLRAEFKGNGLNNLNGTAQGHSVELSRNGVPMSLQEFDIQLTQSGRNRNLQLRSNEMDASVRGLFDWENLPNLGLSLGNRFFPSWISAPARQHESDQIEFSARTYNIESYLELLHLPISGLSNAQLEGRIDPSNRSAYIRASVPKLQYESLVFQKTTLKAEGLGDSLRMSASIDRINLNDSINIPEARIEVNAHKDTADVQLMAGVSEAIDKADIRSRLIAYSDGLRIDLAPSTFLIQGKLWSIDENGQLILRRDQPAYGNLSLREGDQRIDVRTIPSKTGSNNDIEVSIESLNLHDITPFFMPSNELEGLISAKVRLIDPAGKLQVEADTIQTRFLRFGADSIGELGASLEYDINTNQLRAKGETTNRTENLVFDARVGLSGPVDSNRILLKANAYPIQILERFLGHLFSDIQGTLTGEVELIGDLNNPELYGSGKLKGGGLRVNYTNCFYSIQDADVDVTPTLIDLDGWVLKDSATGNPIYIRGGIAHEAFRNMYYDLAATTRSMITNSDKPVLLLNTDRSQGEVYFGKAKGTLSLQLRGPQSDLILNMQARASDRDSSYLTLLSESGRESGEADFLIEREYGREMTGRESMGIGDNFTVDIEITATPLVNAKVILDELTGDVIRGRGNGTLKIRSGSNEPLSLRGRYNIEEGNYLFTFQSFFKKPFEIRKGGQHFVEWNGDPYDANVSLEAVYKADNVSFAPLASSLNLGSGLNNARGDVYVNAALTDKLFKPQIRFSLGFPPNGIVDRNQELALLVNQLQKNPNELNRQVTYLIVFNSFAPSELAGDPIGSGIGVSTISGVLLNVLSDQINKLLGNLLKSDKYSINLNTSLYNRDWMSANNNALNLGSNINFSIGRSFFNNRFIISGGLGFDAPLGQSTANANLSQSIQLLPDVTMEWLINPSGSLRVGFFYRKSNDFLTNNTNPITARRTGGSLSYQKDYDHLGDLFRGLFRKKKRKE